MTALLGHVAGIAGDLLRGVSDAARSAWAAAHLGGRLLGVLLRGQLPVAEALRQTRIVGLGSLPLVIVTAGLAGAVASQLGGYQFTGMVPPYILGSVVTASVVLELGPVLTAVVLVGRIGARMAAEIGTMRVSEQIDALEMVGRDPVRELVLPRVVAGAISVPVLVAVANLVGVMAGMFTCAITGGPSPEAFLFGARLEWHTYDVFFSLTKGLLFGIAIPFVGSLAGLRTQGGAAGVGEATTWAVVTGTLTVLIIDTLAPPILLQ